jgi:chromosome segregation ATPase
LEATAQHSRELAAAQERYDAALREERARLRLAEALLAEVPTPEELAARQQADVSRTASAVARIVELERELSTARDLVVSERVEQLVARVRALEAELAEQEGGAEELSALRASAAAAAKRAAELEAASAAARSDRGAEVERLLAQNKALEQALHAQRVAVAVPAPAAVLIPAAAKQQPVAAVYPDDIQSQLRRIEALLESLPVPNIGGADAVRA